jgi:hypothetical protein
MAWIAIWIPLMAVGVAIAIIPLVFATHHQYKYGHHGSYPDGQTAQSTAPTSTADLTVCPNCTALVADGARHHNSVHATGAAIA